MTIYEAAVVVLKDSGKDMHVKDIYAEIVSRDLFNFGAKSPVSVLSSTLAKKARVGGQGEIISLGSGRYRYDSAE